MQAVILAGGIGSRLKPFTEIIPKPLLPIGEKSVLEIQISKLAEYGFKDIYFATNYKSEYISNFFGDGSKHGINLTISKENAPLGTAGPLSLLRKELTDPFLVMNGDILTNMDFSKMFNYALKHSSDFVVGIKTIIRPFEFGKIYFEDDLITGIEEKPNLKNEILAGIYIVKPNVLKLVPDNQYYGIDELIKQMLSKKMPIAKYDINEFWIDIGQVDDYEKAQKLYSTHFQEE